MGRPTIEAAHLILRLPRVDSTPDVPGRFLLAPGGISIVAQDSEIRVWTQAAAERSDPKTPKMSIFSWFETRIDPFVAGPARDPPPRLLGLYWHYIRQAPGPILALFILGCCNPVLESLIFVALGVAVDTMVSTPPDAASRQFGGLFWQIPLLLVGSLVCGGLYVALGQQSIVAPFTSLIHWQAHRRVVRRPMSYFQGESSGRVGTQILEIGNTIRTSALQALSSIWFTTIFIVSTGVVFLDLDRAFLMPLALWVAGYSVVIWYFTPRILEGGKISFEGYTQLSGRLVDTYGNISTVKLFGGGQQEDEYIRAGISRAIQANRPVQRLQTLQWLAVNGLDVVLIVWVFSIALNLWAADAIAVGAIVTATGLVIRLHSTGYMIIGGVAGLAQNLGKVQSAMKAIVPENPEPDRRPSNHPPTAHGMVRFDNVAFQYPNGERVLSGLSFSVPSRGSIGIVGLSGAGKTTIVNLLTGLYAPQSGTILIDGHDTAFVSESALFESLSVVSQEPSLFNRSVRDNVRYGRPGATDDEINAALAAAAADEFVGKLEDAHGRRGLNAVVGERGVRLSGGQRQRIAISRAILRDAPIFVLDEPTSALDSETEASIQNTLAKLRERRSLIVIAHRVSTIARLDRILVLHKGVVAEEGTHDELVSRGGQYFTFWQHQTEGAAVS
ncbi:MAG: ABC transporter ATP-binding protein [Bauldia sp.]|nr:ABC transporter ATP-binding protein [Bauldia sp.]